MGVSTVKVLNAKAMRRIRTRLLYVLGIALITIVSAHAAPPVQEKLSHLEPGQYSVSGVFDGDTIQVDMYGRQESIRLIGVDTPETHHPNKPVQCFGHAASDFTKATLERYGNIVSMEADEYSSNRDRYNRLLRYVYLPDGTLLNQAIIEEGYGFAYTAFLFAKSDEFTAAETRARQSNAGLWSACPV